MKNQNNSKENPKKKKTYKKPSIKKNVKQIKGTALPPGPALPPIY